MLKLRLAAISYSTYCLHMDICQFYDCVKKTNPRMCLKSHSNSVNQFSGVLTDFPAGERFYYTAVQQYSTTDGTKQVLNDMSGVEKGLLSRNPEL